MWRAYFFFGAAFMAAGLAADFLAAGFLAAGLSWWLKMRSLSAMRSTVGFYEAATTGVPQFAQNFAPSARSAEQFVHLF